MCAPRADGRRPAPPTAVAVAAAVVAFTLTGLVVAGGAVPALDRHVLDLVDRTRPAALGTAAGAVADVLSPPVDLAVLLAASAWLSRRDRSWRPVAVAAAAVAALLVVVLSVKYGVGRPAPPPHHSTDGGAFPSGHTASALVGYGTLALLLAERRPALSRRLVLLAAVATVVVGTAMVYGGFHWLSDVVAAVGFGALVLVFVHVVRVRTVLSGPVARRERARPQQSDRGSRQG